MGRLALACALFVTFPDAHPDAAPAPDARAPLLIGFYDGWDPGARRGLGRRLGSMDVFAPKWITVRGASAQVVVEPDQDVPALIRSLPRPPRVFPLISNAHDAIWDQPAAQALIFGHAAAQSAFAARLVELARANGYGGYVFDLEGLSPQALAGYPALLAALKAALAPAGREVWVTASVGAEQPSPALSAAADAVVLMAYDECWAGATPGPIAGEDWVAAVLASRMLQLDPRRVILGLGSYGYDWPEGGRASPLGVGQAVALAARVGATIRRDPSSGNETFAYASGDGARHQVWFADARAFAAGARIAAGYGVRGLAVWRIGLEDPAIWRTPRASFRGSAKPRARPDAPLPHPCGPLPAR